MVPECAIELAVLNASEKQRRLMRAFFDRQDEDGRKLDIFACLGGNRSGKSFTAGVLCFALYLRDYAKDGDWFWCIGQNLDRSVGGQQQELWKALPRWMFGDQVWDEKNGFGMARAIVLPTRDGGKCLVEFRSADQAPHTFEQAKLTGVWIDERVAETIFGRLLSRIVDRDGWIIYSDLYEQFWQFERLVEAKPEAGVLCIRFTMYDNAHNLPEGIIDRRKAQMSTEEQAQKIMGELVLMEGIVYKEYRDTYKPNGHLVTPFAIPGNGKPPYHGGNWPRWRLIDYGASAPTAGLWVALAPNEHLYAYREYYQRGLSVAKNAEAIVAMSEGEHYVATLMDPHAVDKPPVTYGAAKSIAEQYEEAGIPSTGWPFVNVMGEHAMVQRVKYRLEHNMLWVFDHLLNFRREMRSWKHQCDKEGRPLAKDAYENDNNHLLDDLKGFLGTNPTFTQTGIEVTGGE